MDNQPPSPQIFISVKNLDDDGNQTKDVEMALELHRQLESRGIACFLSVVSLELMGVAEYKGTIDDALDHAEILIAVGTSPENLTSRWVRYEWDSFFNDIISGIKPEAKVFSLISGLEPTDLPRALRQNQTFEYEKSGIDYLCNFATNSLDLNKAIHDRDQEEELRKIAEHETSVAKEVSEFLVKLFENTDPVNSGGGQLSAKGILDAGSNNLQQDLQKQPLVKAKLLKTIGEAYCGLGEYEPALDLFNQAIEIQEPLLEKDDETLLNSRVSRAWSLYEAGDYSQALFSYQDLGIVDNWRNLEFEKEHPLIRAINDYGVLLSEMDQSESARQVLQRAVEINEQLGLQEDLATSLQNLALTLPRKENVQSAILYDRALEILEATLGHNHPTLIVILANAAKTNARVGNREKGLKLLDRATSIAASVYDSDHPIAGNLSNSRGLILYGDEDYNKALSSFVEATTIFVKAYGERHSATAASMQHQARCFKKLGDLESSRHLYESSVRAYKACLGLENPNSLGPCIELAEVLVELGEDESAQPLIHHCIEQAKEQRDKSWSDVLLKQGTDLLSRINQN